MSRSGMLPLNSDYILVFHSNILKDETEVQGKPPLCASTTHCKKYGWDESTHSTSALQEVGGQLYASAMKCGSKWDAI
jgi:hypothetical protein